MQSLTARIKNHPAVVYLGAITLGFVAGISVYHWTIDIIQPQNLAIETLKNENIRANDFIGGKDAWIANSYGVSNDKNCIQKARKAFVELGLPPKVSSKSSAPGIFSKTKGVVAQVRCVNRDDGEKWWFVMVVANEKGRRIEIRNKIHDALTN